MAAVLEPKDAAAKHNSQVDEQIAQATSRIRAHDAAFGGLVLAALVLGYATAVILLDKYFNLAPWVRQVTFVGFIAALAATAYLTLLRPFRKRINPLYAAKQVEGTLDDPKNSVTGYVDAREKGDLNATVKAALASRAAKAAAEADVNRAVNHRSLVWLGGAAIALLLTLIVLFFVFRPAQFASLANRAFMPFSGGEIKSRTELLLVKPEPLDPTITTGQSVTVAVTVKGKVPSADGPDRVRLFVRQSQSDPNYDELPMAQGATSRDWELRVPDHLVNNGFWYKVVGGDAETPEYRVTVRTLPRFDSYTVSYEYPKYLRMPPFTNTDPVVKAPRGTTVMMLAKTNRDVRDGLMAIEPTNQRANGTPDASDPKTLKFVFKVAETGRYKLTFNATNGERTADATVGVITVEGDRSPDAFITAPETDETEQPSNGQQKIEGKLGDDYGIDTVTLKMRTLGAAGRQLPDVPFLNGKSASFRRDADGTYPTDVEYKGSIDFAKIKKDASGLDVALTPGTVIEYWLEVTDNCTEPKANVGVSNKKTVRLGAPKVEPEEKKQLDDQKQQRKDEEKKFGENQQKKLDNENRDRRGEPKDKDGKKDDGKKGADGQPQENPQNNPMGPKENDPKPEPKDGMGTDPNAKPMGDPKPDAKPDPNNKDKGGNNDIDRTARDIQKELDRENQTGASDKPNNTPPDGERPEPGKSKPQPQAGAKGGNDAEQKPDAKADPMSGEGAAGTGKPPAEPMKPEEASTTKPEPKPADPMGGKPDAAPGDNRGQQTGAQPGTDKQPPKEPAGKPPEGKGDPNAGAASKPTEQKPGAPNGTDGKSEPKPAGAKPDPTQPQPGGADKPTGGAQPQPKDAGDKGTDPKGATPPAGDSKPDRSPPAAGAKPQPKGGEQPKGQDSDAKPPAGTPDPMRPNEQPADAKPAGGKTADGKKGDPAAKPRDAGDEKPLPKDAGDKGQPNGGTAPMPKEKMDPEKLKELQDAAKDLAGNDPAKKQAAQDKLDKAIGKDKREELEKLRDDLNSKDDATRQAAEQKVKDAVEKAKQAAGEPKKDDTNPPNAGSGEPKKDQPGAGPGGPKKDDPKGGAPKLTDEQKKDIEKAVNDLQSNDPQKQDAARQKLDKVVGEQNRKDAEQLMKDLKSDDKDKQQAAQKKLDDLRKQMQEQPKKDGGAKTDGSGGANDAKGKDPSPEELTDLAKKAQDLQSPDEKTRQKAQQDLDEKIGKDQRQKLEEALKNRKGDPKEDAERLKRQLEDMTRNRGKKPEDTTTGGGPGSPPPGKPMEDDPKNRAKAAELMLENFKKDENRKKIQDRKGWSDAEYEKFLKELEAHAKSLRDKENEAPKPDAAPMPKDSSNPLLKAGGSGKVEGTGGASGAAGVGGPTAPPPGFEGARNKFQDALKKKP